jgi:hypothetical protein
VAANAEDNVKVATTTALSKIDLNIFPAAALKQLSALRGIGPATASLLLSVAYPDNLPFFSDELFRWICWDVQEGWQKKIKYDIKEYKELWEGLRKLKSRLGGEISTVDLERCAWVIGKVATDKKLQEVVSENSEAWTVKMFSAKDEGKPAEGKKAVAEKKVKPVTEKKEPAKRKATVAEEDAEPTTKTKSAAKKGPKQAEKDISPPPANPKKRKSEGTGLRRSTRSKT